jgi:hypothetical protein
MSLIMVCSIFAPVVASAVEFYGHEHKDEGCDTLHYVSIGDSMTNGFGLDGYYLTPEEVEYWKTKQDREVMESGQVYGFLQEVPVAYPALFRDYLAKKNNCEVDLTQLAISSLRAEDIWYLLTFDPETGKAAWDGDGYTAFRNINNLSATEVAYTGYSVAELSGFFRKYVSEADVISLAVGPNNFSTFFNVAQMNDAMYGDEHTKPDWDYITEHLDAATAKDLEDLFEDLRILSDGAINDITNMIPNSESLDAEMIKFYAERMIYTTASFAIGFKGIVDEINKLNPDAEIVVVNMVNWLDGVVFSFDGVDMPIGDIFQKTYDFANAYMAAIATSYEKDEDCDLDFYYADVTDVEYEMIIEDIFDGTASDATREALIASKVLPVLTYLLVVWKVKM